MRDDLRWGRATAELKLAICSGELPIPPPERIELLTILAADLEEAIRVRASAALLTQPLANVLAALGRTDGAPEMFAYCAAEFPRRPGIADALANNPGCPIAVLRPVVRYLSVPAVQQLFEDLDRLSMSPPLVAALLASTVINADQCKQLLELQSEEFQSIEKLSEHAESVEPDAGKRETLLQRLSRMRVSERVQVALKGGRDERSLLIRDSCKVVQRAVLQSPKLSDREVEGFAAMANLSEESLRLIAINRKYRKNYTVTRALINNPKTPLEITLHLLPTITAQDLKALSGNKNVPDTLRTSAGRLIRQRTPVRE